MPRKARVTKFQELDYVLLSLIRAHPAVSGYQLRGIINDSTGYFFHAHLSQIYPALRRLSDAKMVTFKVEAREGKPDLKLYTITDAGTRELHAWLVKPYEFELSRANSDRYFLKLIMMGFLEPDEIVDYIDQGIQAFTQQEKRIVKNNLQLELDFIAQVEGEAHDRYMFLWSHELDFMVHEIRARIEWLENLKKDLQEGK